MTAEIVDEDIPITLRLSWGTVLKVIAILGRAPHHEVWVEIGAIAIQADTQFHAHAAAQAAAERAAAIAQPVLDELTAPKAVH